MTFTSVSEGVFIIQEDSAWGAICPGKVEYEKRFAICQPIAFIYSYVYLNVMTIINGKSVKIITHSGFMWASPSFISTQLILLNFSRTPKAAKAARGFVVLCCFDNNRRIVFSLLMYFEIDFSLNFRVFISSLYLNFIFSTF